MAMRGKPKTNTKKIGDKELSPATLMMGLGYDPVLSEGSLKPPIFLTSTFAFESAAAGKRFFEHITGKREGPADGLVYSRFNGPNQEILEDRLAVWDGRSEEPTSELQSLMRISYAVFCLKNKNKHNTDNHDNNKNNNT